MVQSSQQATRLSIPPWRGGWRYSETLMDQHESTSPRVVGPLDRSLHDPRVRGEADGVVTEQAILWFEAGGRVPP